MAGNDGQVYHPIHHQPFFLANDSMADITFVVQQRPVVFCKALLMVSSPVFARMFTSNFREMTTKVVPLPDKDYDSFVCFLSQVHPAYSWAPLSEESVEHLLKLADEYDVQHIKKKCAHFIRKQMELTLTINQMLKYLRLCKIYSLHDRLVQALLTLAADHPVEELQRCQYYSKLECPTQVELVVKRCKLLEDEKVDSKHLIEAGRIIRKLKHSVHTLPAIVDSLPENCDYYRCMSSVLSNYCFGVHCERSGKITNSQISCQFCKLDTSGSRWTFCKDCVLEKTAAMVSRFHDVLKPVSKVP